MRPKHDKKGARWSETKRDMHGVLLRSRTRHSATSPDTLNSCILQTHEVRVAFFAQVVVVELVVLHVPGFHQHPVQPVLAALVDAAHPELEPVEFAVAALVEAPVAHVVADDGPTGHGPHTHQEDGHRVEHNPAGERAHPRAKAAVVFLFCVKIMT